MIFFKELLSSLKKNPFTKILFLLLVLKRTKSISILYDYLYIYTNLLFFYNLYYLHISIG
jgi:hypothetical protein